MLSGPEAPAGLDVGGLDLWSKATAAKAMHPGELVVLEEACRIKDRLDVFNGLLVGDESEWLRLKPVRDEPQLVVVVDSVVTEARLHAGELRQLVEKLRLPFRVAGAGPKEGDVTDPLAAARAEREKRLRDAAAAG